MLKKDSDGHNEPVSKNISLVWSIDQSFPPELVFINRVMRLVHSGAPEVYGPCTLNFLNVSTLTSDFPLNPLFNFDPRDYHRFRFKTETTFLKQAADFMGGHIIFVNDLEHTKIIMHPTQLQLGDTFPHIDTTNIEASKVLELRTRLVHQGEVPNLSKLIKFWSTHEPVGKILSRFNIDINALKGFKLHKHHKIDSISSLLNHPIFLRFLSIRSDEINYLSIFPDAVLNMLRGLPYKKILSATDKDSLSMIIYYCEKAILFSDVPVEFTKYIHLIFEEIKLLLSDSVYTLNNFKQMLKKLFRDGEPYYANSGSNALSIILEALSHQKKEKLKIVSIGCKYYEESISLNYTGHELLTVGGKEKIDVLRIDLKSPANCQRKYKNFDVLSIMDFLIKNNLCSEHFSLVIDGTLNSLSDAAVKKLNLDFKNKLPKGNFVYFGSGVKSHCLGVDIATFGWITVNNSNEHFSKFNHYLQIQSQRNATENPDFQYVTHLLSCCTTQLIQYHDQLLLNTKMVYSALKNNVDIAIYNGNDVPYLEIFSEFPLEELLAQLKTSLLRYRGSFGFPYPTWLNITNNTNRSSIRISCGLLTEELTASLIELLGSTFGNSLTAKL